MTDTRRDATDGGRVSKRKKWSEMKESVSPEVRERGEARARQMMDGMSEERKAPCGKCYNSPKCIDCDGDRDTLKCRFCGREWTAPCNFDEEYA